MPVDPLLADEVAASVAAVYREGETALIAMITRHLSDGIEASDWATRRLREVAAVGRAAQLIVDRLESAGSADLRRAIAQAYRAGSSSAVVDLAQRHVGDVGHVARGARERGSPAIQALAEAAMRELGPIQRAILPQVQNAYRHAIVQAAAIHLTGADSRRRAAQHAWNTLVDKGVVAFVDHSGRHWRLHTWVEMATRTAVQRAATRGLVDEYLAAGNRLVYVTDTPRNCHLCAPWEHQVLALGEPLAAPAVATLDTAIHAGLMHPQCRHSVAPWWPGVRLSRVEHDPAGYAAEQRQRAIERHVRYWREREAAALSPQVRRHAHARVSAWSDELGRHVAAHGLRRLRFREQIGAGHVPTARRGSVAGTRR